MSHESYVGRFAPSPSGALHLGSLVAALASWLHARAQGGRWLLRMDDLDRPRVVAGAGDRILDMLQAFGLRWDGGVVYQSGRADVYAKAIERLRESGHVFDCGCTRKQAQAGPPGIEGEIYPGTCRAGVPSDRRARSIRIRVHDRPTTVNDEIQGVYRQNLARDIGDFVIRRADGMTAYQLATVVDDAFQRVTDVVRGADLLSSTPRQLYIAECLGYPPPRYAHVPVLVDDEGVKLGKSQGALALVGNHVPAQIWHCLAALGQEPPDTLMGSSRDHLLRWAIDNWSSEHVPKVPKLSTVSYQRFFPQRSGLDQ